jgi:Xaa-Pro aminopeptidase
MQSIFESRRASLYERLGSGAAAILVGAKEVRRNGTNTFRFRQSSDLLYLTGLHEPDAVVVFTPGKARRYTVFLRPRDPVREHWTGRRLGPEDAAEKLGADQAFGLNELETRLYDLCDGCSEVLWHLGEDVETDAMLMRVLRRLAGNERNGARPPYRTAALSTVMGELRLVKDDDALTRMRRAAAITAEAHVLAMRAARAGRREYELEALIDYAFRRNDGCAGYDTIVGCGNNATTLHYTGGRDELADGQLLLVDAGCEWDGYTADVTRTYPVAGKDKPAGFSLPQRRLYDLVLAAQKAGIAAARPGATVEDIHDACVRVATAGLIELGLLSGDVTENIEKNHHRRFYVHRTSHFLGLDVHDVGFYFPGGEPRRLLPGMVLTIEPGLYIREGADVPEPARRFCGLGVRIEDDVLITEAEGGGPGHEVLTRDIPKEPDELLRIVGSGVTLSL